MTSVRKTRQDTIRRFIDPEQLAILEIGALDYPTFQPDQFNVEFLDYKGEKQLSEENPKNPRFNLDRVVKVDYAIADYTSYSEKIDHRFDLVVANHVIEHIPDTIRWLSALSGLLLPSGLIFLGVPDCRYTFDILRRRTIIIDVLRCYRERITKPDFYHILEHMYFKRPVASKDVWNGLDIGSVGGPPMGIRSAIQKAELIAQKPYVSPHCHVYDPESFSLLFSDIRDLDLINLDLVHISDVQMNQNEFHVMLRKDRRLPAGDSP